MREICSRDEVRDLVARGVPLVEVLPPTEYGERHIAGAINVPLKRIDAWAGGVPRDGPVIVYCNDFT